MTLHTAPGIQIVDYDQGNLGSIQYMLSRSSLAFFRTTYCPRRSASTNGSLYGGSMTHESALASFQKLVF